MPRAVRIASQEYWRPADPATARIAGPILAEGLCADCGTEYLIGARFCHACGRERYRRPVSAPSPMTFADFFDVALIRRRLGLSVLSLLFFVVGVICLVTGVLHAIPAGLLSWLVLRRGFAVNSVSAGLVAGTLAGLAGVGLLELHCSNFQAIHILVWHTAVLLVSGGLGALVGRVLQFRKGLRRDP